MYTQLADRPLVKKLRTPHGYYAYDSRTNRLLRITPATYDILDYFGSTPEPEIRKMMADRYPAKDIAHALKTLSGLVGVHGLFRAGPLEDRAKPLCQDAVAAYLKHGSEMLTLEVTDACNLRCKYCIFPATTHIAECMACTRCHLQRRRLQLIFTVGTGRKLTA